MSWERSKVNNAELVIAVDAIMGKERPRSSYANGVFRTYTPKRTQKAEQFIAEAFMRKYGARFKDYSDELEIRVAYWRCLAKSNPKFWIGRADLGKPDCDNVLKLVLDALKGIAYAEDSSVTYASVRKMPRAPLSEGNHIVIQIDYYKETYTKEPKNGKN